MRFLEPVSCLIIRLKFKFDIHENKFKLELIEELFPKLLILTFLCNPIIIDDVSFDYLEKNRYILLCLCILHIAVST